MKELIEQKEGKKLVYYVYAEVRLHSTLCLSYQTHNNTAVSCLGIQYYHLRTYSVSLLSTGLWMGCFLFCFVLSISFGLSGSRWYG